MTHQEITNDVMELTHNPNLYPLRGYCQIDELAYWKWEMQPEPHPGYLRNIEELQFEDTYRIDFSNIVRQVYSAYRWERHTNKSEKQRNRWGIQPAAAVEYATPGDKKLLLSFVQALFLMDEELASQSIQLFKLPLYDHFEDGGHEDPDLNPWATYEIDEIVTLPSDEFQSLFSLQGLKPYLLTTPWECPVLHMLDCLFFNLHHNNGLGDPGILKMSQSIYTFLALFLHDSQPPAPLLTRGGPDVPIAERDWIWMYLGANDEETDEIRDGIVYVPKNGVK